MIAVVLLWIMRIAADAGDGAAWRGVVRRLRVAPAKEVFAPFADPLMFLFIGSFILAQAIFHHISIADVAFTVLSRPWIGATPRASCSGFGAVTAAISGLDLEHRHHRNDVRIGLSILRVLYQQQDRGGRRGSTRGGPTGLMLMTSFAASIGGLATPVGTPPNVIGLGFIRGELGVRSRSSRGCCSACPTVAVLFVVLFFVLNTLSPSGVTALPWRARGDPRRSRGPWPMDPRASAPPGSPSVSRSRCGSARRPRGRAG